MLEFYLLYLTLDKVTRLNSSMHDYRRRACHGIETYEGTNWTCLVYREIRLS